MLCFNSLFKLFNSNGKTLLQYKRARDDCVKTAETWFHNQLQERRFLSCQVLPHLIAPLEQVVSFF